MIVAESGKNRRFIGSLDKGRDAIAGLREFCAENEVLTGWISGSAVIRDLVLKPLQEEGFGEEPEVFEGVWFCPFVNGNLSTKENQTDVRLYGIWSSLEGRQVQGILEGGSVELFEFTVLTVDDLQLERDVEDPGYSRWVFLSPLRKEKEVSRYELTNQRTRHLKKNTPTQEELSELMLEEMRPGDILLHPTLGRCTIVDHPKDERIPIRLESGKKVSLAAKVILVSPYRVENGVRVFPVQIRRN